MDIYAIPIINGVLPRPDGGLLQGVFLDPFFAKMLNSAGIGGHVFIFPLSLDEKILYPVGVLARIEDMWFDKLSPESNAKALFARVLGRERLKAKNFAFLSEGLVARGLERLDVQELRSLGYPAVCGAGWYPTGGYTTFGSNKKDAEVTIYGFDLETGRNVSIVGHLGNLIEPEKAHTVEHAIIRSLKNYSLCTPKTLRDCIEKETEELKWSVEIGIAKKLPEVFGVTRSGICGNPLTHMASYYLNEELRSQLKSGENLIDSISAARNKTVSKLTKEMDISTQKGKRELQGLKKGMFHDDTPEELNILKQVLYKFPINPWS